jgi:hypothetical protein
MEGVKPLCRAYPFPGEETGMRLAGALSTSCLSSQVAKCGKRMDDQWSVDELLVLPHGAPRLSAPS